MIRVLPNEPGVDLAPWLTAINSADVLPPLREMRIGQAFVATVCDDESSLDAHLDALYACATGIGQSVRDLDRHLASVVVNIAVEPEDREWLNFDIGFPPALLAELGAAGIGLVVTFYAGEMDSPTSSTLTASR